MVDLPTPKEKVDMNQATTSLYERLGRRDGITRITADLMKNHLANPLVNARYLNSEDLARIFQPTPVKARTASPLECPFIEVSSLDRRAGDAEAKLYRSG
jgi:hypothetical protein